MCRRSTRWRHHLPRRELRTAWACEARGRGRGASSSRKSATIASLDRPTALRRLSLDLDSVSLLLTSTEESIRATTQDQAQPKKAHASKRRLSLDSVCLSLISSNAEQILGGISKEEHPNEAQTSWRLE